MVLDLNDAALQPRQAHSAIPARSIVLVRLTIRPPALGEAGGHPLVTALPCGCSFLQCDFEVVSGRYQGRLIREHLALTGVTRQQKQRVQTSRRTLRAVVEAVRAIHPSNASLQAAAGRLLEDVSALQGAIFAIQTGLERRKPGLPSLRNSVALVITPDHPAYTEMMAEQHHASQATGSLRAPAAAKPPAGNMAGTHQATPALPRRASTALPPGRVIPAWARSPVPSGFGDPLY